MKLVLCGVHQDYSRFLDTLELKGKSTNDYRYINIPLDLNGYEPTCEIIKLGSFKNNIYKEHIEHEVASRFMARPRMRTRVRAANEGIGGFQSGGIITPVQGHSPTFTVASSGSDDTAIGYVQPARAFTPGYLGEYSQPSMSLECRQEEMDRQHARSEMDRMNDDILARMNDTDFRLRAEARAEHDQERRDAEMERISEEIRYGTPPITEPRSWISRWLG